jgi:pantothenate kinase
LEKAYCRFFEKTFLEEHPMIRQPAVIDLDGLVALARTTASGRCLIAIVGAPGSGKSTAAESLVAQVNAVQSGSAAILPMDGYHFDDAVLTARGLRARKGAPDTFDVGGLRHMLRRLKLNEEDEIAVPVFDRAIEISRSAARLIPKAVRVVVVEGNYLLLDLPPWSDLRMAFDATVMIDVSEEILRRRLTERWESYALSPEDVKAKVELNDLVNGRFVAANSSVPNFILHR